MGLGCLGPRQWDLSAGLCSSLLLFGSSVLFHSVSCLGAIYFSACPFVTAGSLYKCASRVSGCRRDIGSSDLSRRLNRHFNDYSKNWRRNCFNLRVSLQGRACACCLRLVAVAGAWMKPPHVCAGIGRLIFLTMRTYDSGSQDEPEAGGKQLPGKPR